MIKFIDILKEITLNEFQKSQVDFVSNKLNIPNDDILKSTLNSLDSQGIKYPDIKSQILNRNIKNLNDLNKLKTPSKQDKLKSIKNHEIEKVIEKNGISIYVPYTHTASCIYGANTKWCTASKGDYKDYFNIHALDHEETLYYIIDKNQKDEFKKVAITVNKNGKIIDIRDSKNYFDWDTVSFAKDTTTIEQAYQNYLNYLKSKGINPEIFVSKSAQIKNLNSKNIK
jgi:hypothetical protein